MLPRLKARASTLPKWDSENKENADARRSPTAASDAEPQRTCEPGPLGFSPEDHAARGAPRPNHRGLRHAAGRPPGRTVPGGVPHRPETRLLATDPLCTKEGRDGVGLYLHPPDTALALCTDETSQIQAPDRRQPLWPMRPGERNGGPPTTHGIAPRRGLRTTTE